MFTLRRMTLALAMTGLLCNAVSAADATAQSAQPVRVLASLPITYGLGQILLKDSDVVLERAAAANLPGSRQTAYFTGRGAEALRGLAVKADAVIGLRSIWADDPLYPNARRSNIRIVEIDAARPVDGSLPGIAVQPGQGVDGLNSQPWLASNNMGRMADVMSADLVRLAPAAKPKIEGNLAALKQQLLKLSASSEASLASADNLSVVSLSDRFGYLVSGLNLELIDSQALTDEQWTPEAVQKLAKTLKDNDVALVLDHRQPPEPVKAAIAEAGSKLLVLGIDGADPLAELQGDIEQIIGALK
ncbi:MULTISPECIES: metal ABC transporter solute-binding protein, Zn/Mn family [Pseudomonas syringae group]|uniref:ABC transporter, periplasmic substrate-binding protein n=1 Tax=Pseudomonas syringae pv. primulae TaxID=251707 RepID=A0A0Q0DE16_9PSED|nr:MULTISPECIES: zinc ABC transporter substrate-binding protein [Pseudomonas syringae group]KPY36857.1 ABC transporter, periplasmic substrate-binding protein [Pseudomonas syringae pv. primulae]MBD8187857.1 zinc ABC transporter substrate-binding protein [Pseudomonas viridiflava]MBD8200330.1 zinc ABC transporter substrate-binding protein [Pseudomonas viridiflava]TKJ66251.1 metal ABC transporter substrate-binding protein [Pseudomonas viridiflava]TKK29695.1 metal ABC transporter substrate-binding 